MSREKHIEEMAKVGCGGTDCNRCVLKPSCEYIRNATLYYKAGYRKQSVGEWIEHSHFNFEGGYGGANYECSNCRFDDIYDLDNMNYCPNCGAKMKGGE